MSTIRNLYFTLDGRVDRTTYWVFAFAVTAIVNLIWTLPINAAVQNAFGWEPDSLIAWLVEFSGSIVIGLVGSFAISVKRLHDQNRTAWLLLIALAPIFGSIILLVMLGFVPGTKGDNRYGAAPKRSGTQVGSTEEQTGSHVSVPNLVHSAALGFICAGAFTINAFIAMGGDGFPNFNWIISAVAIVSWAFFTWVLSRRPDDDAMAYLTFVILTVAAFLLPVASLSMVYVLRDVQDPIFPPWLYAIVLSILGIIAGIILLFATRSAKPTDETGAPWD